MALWQYAYLERDRALSANSGTVYVDLPKDEQIAALHLKCEATAADVTAVVNSYSMLDAVSDIQVMLEGSKTAFYATAPVAAFLHTLITGRVPGGNLGSVGSLALDILIPFSMSFPDARYMLDTSRYSSAQLQFSFSLNTTCVQSGSFKYTAGLIRPVEKINPVGFVRHRVINRYTTAMANEVFTVNLPTGLKWALVGMRAYRWGDVPNSILSRVDLDVGQGRLHLFQGDTDELVTLNACMLDMPDAGPMTRQALAEGVDGATLFGLARHVTVYPMSTTAFAFAVPAINGTTFTMGEGTQTTAVEHTVQASGYLPFSCMVIFDGREQVFNAAAYADAHLEIVAGTQIAMFDTFVSEVVEGTL